MTSFAKVRRSGFHSDLVERAVLELTGDVLPRHSLYSVQASFDDDAVFRHMDYVGIGEGQLVAMHLDEAASGLRWILTAVPFRMLGPVDVAREFVAVPGGGGYGSDELMIHICMSSVTTIDLDRTQCDDAECDYDHGYNGLLKRDGISLVLRDDAADYSCSSTRDGMSFVRTLTALIAG